jgi:hypothetical protein
MVMTRKKNKTDCSTQSSPESLKTGKRGASRPLACLEWASKTLILLPRTPGVAFSTAYWLLFKIRGLVPVTPRLAQLFVENLGHGYPRNGIWN